MSEGVRRCRRCPNPLSIYNKSDVCNSCQAREKNAVLSGFPLDRDKPLLEGTPLYEAPVKVGRPRQIRLPPPKIEPAVEPTVAVEVEVQAAEVPEPEPIAETMPPKAEENRMDTLVSRTIRAEDMPALTQRSGIGRLGELWAKVRSLQPGFVEVVENRDEAHAKKTRESIQKKARSAGRKVGSRRDGTKVYVWLLPEKAEKNSTKLESEA